MPSENSDIERVCRDQALHKGATETTGLCGDGKGEGEKRLTYEKGSSHRLGRCSCKPSDLLVVEKEYLVSLRMFDHCSQGFISFDQGATLEDELT